MSLYYYLAYISILITILYNYRKSLIKYLFKYVSTIYTFNRLFFCKVYQNLTNIRKGNRNGNDNKINISRIYLIMNREILDLTDELNGDIKKFNWDNYIKGDHSMDIAINSRLEIVYNIEDDDYIIVFPYDINQPVLPSKTEKDSNKFDLWIDLDVEPEYSGDIDQLWNELEKYAGPRGDFYEELPNADWILSHDNDNTLPRPLLPPGSRITLANVLGEVLQL